MKDEQTRLAIESLKAAGCGVLAIHIESRIAELEKESACLKQDAERYRKQKEFPQIKMDTFKGKYRAHNGFRIVSDWCDTYDEAFDFAVVAMQKD